MIEPQTVTVCPPELRVDLPSQPRVPDGAVITANPAGQSWVDALVLYAAGLRGLLIDAKAVCEVNP